MYNLINHNKNCKLKNNMSMVNQKQYTTQNEQKQIQYEMYWPNKKKNIVINSKEFHTILKYTTYNNLL